MAASIDLNRTVNGLRAVGMENDTLSVTVLPDVGAKIYDLIWKPTGRNFLWHNPRIAPQPYPIEANFDNYWCGGWDDGFPTCEACQHQGENYPNLGELRSVRWQAGEPEQTGDGQSITFTAYGPINPVRARKTVTIASESPRVRMRYEITNLGVAGIDFIWGTHPALAVTPGMVLRIPARTGIVGLASDPKFGTPGQRYAWPMLATAGGTVDVSRTLPFEAGISSGQYATDLDAGWYAAEDTATGQGFLLNFPVRECPYLWLWLVYGGWRGYHHVIVEPWTSYPVTLSDAVKQNTHRRLEPGQTFQVEVQATIYAPPQTFEDVLRKEP
jgi:hypothetical protein